MTGSYHVIMVTGRDGEGVGLDCSCGWEWNSGFIAENLHVVTAEAWRHTLEVMS